MLIFSCKLLIIFGLPCTLQSTPCEHFTTVKTLLSATANERRQNWLSVKINNGGTQLTVIF